MARLPRVFNFMRPFIAKFRINVLKFLGLYELRNFVGTRGGINSPIDMLMVRMSDRLSVLESQVNWRLYGMPARVCNIKLEQTRLLAGSGDVEKALNELKIIGGNSKVTFPDSIIPSSFSNVILFEGDETDELISKFVNCESLIVVEDESDLFFPIKNQSKKMTRGKGVETLTVPFSSALARLNHPEFEFVWFSSFIERITPIQAQIAFMRTYNSLHQKGIFSGCFVDYSLADVGSYWLDPRRLRPITREFVKAVAVKSGFSTVEFLTSDKNDVIFFKCVK